MLIGEKKAYYGFKKYSYNQRKLSTTIPKPSNESDHFSKVSIFLCFV